jgi:hypothetical protein
MSHTMLAMVASESAKTICGETNDASQKLLHPSNKFWQTSPTSFLRNISRSWLPLSLTTSKLFGSRVLFIG